jgi:ribonucleoside-diphosphate reductase alpha chain
MERFSYSVDEAAQSAGIGLTKLREEIRAGRLVARKVGKRTVVTATDLAAWAARLPKRHDTAAAVVIMRECLENRRASETFGFDCNALRYVATVSFFRNGKLAEIFISNAKEGSHSDCAAKDSAVVCSIALQYGAPLETIRHALLRDASGQASSPLGAALDLVAEQGMGSVL